MAKAKSIFVCSECGYESAKWLGKCPSCNSWNTFYEEKIQETTSSGKKVNLKDREKPKNLNSIEGKEAIYTKTGYGELDRVLGGGLVKGSLVLIGGEPGIGKSTLILQLANKIAEKEGTVLYVSGEESGEQVKLRADRLNIQNDNIMFLAETDIDNIEAEIMEMKPKLVVRSMPTEYNRFDKSSFLTEKTLNY